jgi:hypothetical protein
VEEGVGPEALGIGLEGAAAVDEDGLQGVEVGEGPIGDRFIHERPEPFGWLQLGGGGGQEDQIDADGEAQVVGDVPAGPIDHQHRPVRGIEALIPGKGGQGQRHGRRVDGGQQAPPTGAGAGTDKAIDIEPLVVARDPRQGTLALRGPDPAQDRQQAQPMFVLGPQTDRGLGMGRPHGSDG